MLFSDLFEGLIEFCYELFADFVWLLIGCIAGYIGFSGTQIPRSLYRNFRNDYYSPTIMLLVCSGLTGGASMGIARICQEMEASFQTRLLTCGGANLLLIIILRLYGASSRHEKFRNPGNKTT